MKRWIVAIGVVVALFAAVLIGAVVTLNSIDWNEYREPIAQAVRDATGREIDLRGELGLRVGFSPSVTVDDVSFSNAEWGSEPNMATIKSLRIRLRLLPLVFGLVEVGRVELIGLQLLLETNADGVGNWVFAASESSEAAGPAEEETADGGAPGLTATVRAALIEDARLVYRDGVTGESQVFEIRRLSAQSKTNDSPLTLDVDAAYGDEPVTLAATLEGIQQLLAGGPLGVDLEAGVGGAKITVTGRIAAPLEGTGIDLALAIEGETLAAFSGLAGSPVPDIGPYRLRAKVSGGGDAYQVKDLLVGLGSTEITGDVTARLDGARPRIEAVLRSPRIDLADLSEQSGEAGEEALPPVAAEPSATGDERLFSDEPLPLEALRAVDAAVSLQVEELVADTIHLRNLSLAVDLSNGKLVVESFETRIAGGRIAATVTLDASRKRAVLKSVVKVEQLDIGALVRAQGSDVLEGGRLDLDVDITGRGESVRAIMASLDGSLELQMARATIRDQYAEIALSDLGSVLRQGGTGEAELTCLVGRFDVRNGIATPSGLVVDTPSLALFGTGQIDLTNERLDLEFDREARKVSVTQALPPFRLGGTLASPEPGLAVGAIAGRILDLGAGIVTGTTSKATAAASEGPERCRQLLASYARNKVERAATRKHAVTQHGDLGKEGRKAVKQFRKFLFGD